jgi:exodeoxyribonuclease VII small subunit
LVDEDMTDDKKNFETSLKELEQVVAKLEAGNLGLEESIQLYEKGVRLNQLCEGELKKAEEKIEKLKEQLKAETPTITNSQV